ncbi:hypothetical protein CFB3_32700 [Clostridium folliculivorans]|uniref:Uncharacterized protein n=1 Tax=Clostridium folliculivorans TaxID=2886038 RepID=A0A9W6DA70_9CLOT|nr:hypothetical protein CFOLD11_18910 [Clostridium folliculivorans]GKU31163.1 hypothetical protein CFB3_32700 [Clostridium folliculivorans]
MIKLFISFCRLLGEKWETLIAGLGDKYTNRYLKLIYNSMYTYF